MFTSSVSHDDGSLLSSLSLEESDDLLVTVLEGIVKGRVLPPINGVHVHVAFVDQEFHHVKLAW